MAVKSVLETERPSLVFLHGLLGTKHDWQAVIDRLPHFDCISLDLPLHGEQKTLAVTDFEQTCVYLSQKIESAVGNKPYMLIGYSLGGRLALYYALQSQVEKGELTGLILEGANLGLLTAAEKQVRWDSDQQWAQRFANEAPSAVLNDWYRQAVFADLNEAQRQRLIEKRTNNCGENITQMLLATSLAKQPDFRSLVKEYIQEQRLQKQQLQKQQLHKQQQVRSKTFPIHFFCGERDQKFRRQAEQHQLNLTLIKQAGHNAHTENPDEFAAQLTALFA